MAGSCAQLLAFRFIGGAAMEMWRQARLAMIADLGKQGRQMTGMFGTEGLGRLIGPALDGIPLRGAAVSVALNLLEIDLSIRVIVKSLLPLAAADDDMVKPAVKLDSGLSHHGRTLPIVRSLVTQLNTRA